MNEFVDPSPQPTGNPRRQSARWFPEPDGSLPPGLPLPPSSPPELTPARRRGSLGRPPPSRQVRVVWNGWDYQIEGAGIADPGEQSYASVRPAGRLGADVRQAFAGFLAENIVAAVWPAPSMGLRPPAGSAELLNVAEELVDPRLLAAELVRATVQVAAVHAGIPLPVARVMGQAAKDVFVSLVSPDPDVPEVQAVQYVDLTLSAVDGSLINSPALHEIAVGETADIIDRLLGPDARVSPSPASPALPSGFPAQPPSARPPGVPEIPPEPSPAPRPPGPGFGI